MAARSAYYTQNINNGSLTRNEARILEGRAPLAGLDEPLQPLNMATPGAADKIQNPEQPAAPVPAPAPAPPAPKKKKAEIEPDRIEAIARASAERVARKETALLLPLVTQLPMPAEQIEAALAKHADFVATALGVTPEAAAGYVKARGTDAINKGAEERDIYESALAKLETLALKGSL
jgi:hypothetical protein